MRGDIRSRMGAENRDLIKKTGEGKAVLGEALHYVYQIQ